MEFHHVLWHVLKRVSKTYKGNSLGFLSFPPKSSGMSEIEAGISIPEIMELSVPVHACRFPLR